MLTAWEVLKPRVRDRKPPHEPHRGGGRPRWPRPPTRALGIGGTSCPAGLFVMLCVERRAWHRARLDLGPNPDLVFADADAELPDYSVRKVNWSQRCR